jgi:hypothetical protein
MEKEPQIDIKPRRELPKEEIKEVDPFNWIIPECCREGWESCPHVLKKQRKTKTNIGL